MADEKAQRIVVVGAATLDYKARATAETTPDTCHAGRLFTCPGGSARNVAENLARLRVRTHLITALGGDAAGSEIIRLSALAGVEMHATQVFAAESSPLFLATLDRAGKVVSGIHELGLLERLTPDVLERNEDMISKATTLVCDTTVPVDTIRRLHEMARRHKAGIVVVPTSPMSPSKVRVAMKDALLVTPNAREAGLLTDCDTSTDDGVRKAAQVMLDAGVRLVLITRSELGAYFKSKDDELMLPGMSRTPVDSFGASDAFVAGFLYGMSRSLPLVKTMEIAQLTARLTLDTMYSVHPKLGIDYIHSSVA